MIRKYLPLTYRHDAPNPSETVCKSCQSNVGLHRCRDCQLKPMLCLVCMRASHLNNPLHRLEKFEGGCFRNVASDEAALEVCLGHQGEPCPVGSTRIIITVSELCIQKKQFRFCRCGGQDEGEQLADSGFFPATEKVVATVFTFGTLDEFLRSNVVSKSSVHDYIKRLRVASDPIDPSSISVCSCLARWEMGGA